MSLSSAGSSEDKKCNNNNASLIQVLSFLQLSTVDLCMTEEELKTNKMMNNCDHLMTYVSLWSFDVIVLQKNVLFFPLHNHTCYFVVYFKSMFKNERLLSSFIAEICAVLPLTSNITCQNCISCLLYIFFILDESINMTNISLH